MIHFQQNVVCFGGARRIERIEIENFKAIRKLDIAVPPSSDNHESWLMFVGENATGKSSILQAVALALLGPSVLAEAEPDARRVVSHGANEGAVRLHLPNLSEPLTVGFSKRSTRFDFTQDRIELFRRTARRQTAADWIAGRTKVSERRFAEIALALKRLLLLAGDDAVVRERGRLKVRFGDHTCPLPDISDGYRAVVTLALDIMMTLGTELAEGIVLVDEIETHLHPAWKLEIVSRLRRVFPRLHFLATTHDPLCLRGLRPGEIVVLRRSGHDLSAESVTQSVDHLRADQLLTSPLFGLLTTRAAEFQRQTDRYSQLLGQVERSRSEEEDLLHLRTALDAGIQTSESPAEQCMERATRMAVHNNIRQKLAEILA